MVELRIETKALRKFARALRESDPELARGLRLVYKEAGNRVAQAARSRAAYSSRIPGSIRVSATQVARVAVLAGGPQALDAVVLEHRGEPGTFRHPVYGNRNVWVEQLARPFLHPALAEKGDEARELVATALLATFRFIQTRTEAA